MKHTCRNTQTQRGMHSVHRNRQKPDRAKPIHSESRQVKKRKDTRAQEAWVLLYKILEKNYRCTRGKNLHALWITVLTVIKLS